MALMTREMANDVCVQHFGENLSMIKTDHDQVESWRFTHSGGGTLSDKHCKTSYHSSVTKGTVNRKDAARFCTDYLGNLESVLLEPTKVTIRSVLAQILDPTKDVREVSNQSFDIRFPTLRCRQIEGMFILTKRVYIKNDKGEPNIDTGQVEVILALYSEDSELSESWQFNDSAHSKEMFDHYLQYKIWKNLQGQDTTVTALDAW